MTTTPTTSTEARIDSALLDVLHAQWRALGVPFTETAVGEPLEVIDPEALLWCSLAYFGREPRLEEGVRSWYATNRRRVNRQRLNTLAKHHAADPRSGAWRALDGTPRSATRGHAGRVSATAAGILLRAREVFGNDCAAHLLVALLGSPRGVRCRDVANATGYTYRCVAETAAAWADAGLVRVEHGFCTLLSPAPFAELLRCRLEDIATVDWSAAYDCVITLIRTLERARVAGLGDDRPVVKTAIADAHQALVALSAGIPPSRCPAVTTLAAALVPPLT